MIKIIEYSQLLKERYNFGRNNTIIVIKIIDNNQYFR